VLVVAAEHTQILQQIMLVLVAMVVPVLLSSNLMHKVNDE
jgi:hypothetical protein